MATVLPNNAPGAVEILNWRAGQLEFSAMCAFVPGAVIRVQSGDTLWFAEVISSWEGEKGFLITAHVEHSLRLSAVPVLTRH
ncbi:MAG TPA: hypothetical protein VG456_00905 [Candidatus Sulfopaludibacter sp.]|nr:hypothetical protein [Candidatus Sulfopaludibacter sp.]